MSGELNEDTANILHVICLWLHIGSILCWSCLVLLLNCCITKSLPRTLTAKSVGLIIDGCMKYCSLLFVNCGAVMHEQKNYELFIKKI